jgi:hypothetical protein
MKFDAMYTLITIKFFKLLKVGYVRILFKVAINNVKVCYKSILYRLGQSVCQGAEITCRI